jgi:hypothetical protein
MGRRPGPWLETKTAKCLDYLWADGGWLLPTTLAIEVGTDEEHLAQQLYRMQSAGWVESRRRFRNKWVDDRANQEVGGELSTNEWRITPLGVAFMEYKLEKAVAPKDAKVVAPV